MSDKGIKVVVVVPNLNYGRYLKDCLDSIKRQKGVRISVVVVDGGSTDESIEISRTYCSDNDWQILEEPGLGQARSIVLGFEEYKTAEPQEQILCWLNSDDVFLSDESLLQVVKIFETMNTVDIVSLGGYFVDRDGVLLYPVKYDYHPLIRGDVFKRGGGFLQPATFWRRGVYEKIGINSSLRYTFDGDFFLRARASGCNFFCDPSTYIAGYRLHGENLSLNVPEARVAELALLYSTVLERRLAGKYLNLLSCFLGLVGRIPVVGKELKVWTRLINNSLSYITVYRVPSI